MSDTFAKQLRAVEKHRQLVFDAHDFFWKHPETGFREWKCSKYLEDAFEALGYRLTRAGNIPGFYTDIDTGRPGPTLLIMGELDSLICANHPEADPETHYVHACGHSAQSAALLGLAAALREPGMLDGLCGRIRLMSVPAEELLETGYREELRRQGVIRYFGGKVEFMYRGYMDDVDLAFMIHTSTDEKNGGGIKGGSNGCIVKNIRFTGVAAHAGGSPQLGVNALYAATQALSCINALRETFYDEQHVRVHPIITKGGNAVNAIPDEVLLESYVRGATMETITAVNEKVNRALAGSAAAMGAGVELCDRPGYTPLHNDTNLFDITLEAMGQVLEPKFIHADRSSWSTGCTDMGDVSAVMPAIHPYCGGAVGHGHGSDYFIADVESACINSAKLQMIMLTLLLRDGAAAAEKVIREAKPVFPSIKAYFEYIDRVFLDREAVVYGKDGKITLDYMNR